MLGEAEKEKKKKFIVPINSYPKWNRKFKKLKKHHYGFFSSQNRSGEAEKKKIIVPISSYQTRNREFQKNSRKIQKNKKHHYDFFSSQNGLGEAEKERKKNNYRSDQFLHDQE